MGLSVCSHSSSHAPLCAHGEDKSRARSTSPCDVQQVGESATVISEIKKKKQVFTLRRVNQVRPFPFPFPPLGVPSLGTLLSILFSFNICEVAASPGRTGGRLVSDLLSGVTGDSLRTAGARLCASRITPEPPRALAMDMMEGDVMDKLEDTSSVYDFDPITGNIPATKVEITVSCR